MRWSDCLVIDGDRSQKRQSRRRSKEHQITRRLPAQRSGIVGFVPASHSKDLNIENPAASNMKLSFSRHRQAHNDNAIAAMTLSSGDLAEDLRDATCQLKERAERSGIVARILRGDVSMEAYALLLRNLLPVYRSLEAGLDHHRLTPGVRLVVEPALYRSDAIAHDLGALGFDIDRLPLLRGAMRYARRIDEIASTEPCRLIGHAYARYVADLGDGQILRKLLARLLRVPPTALTLYDFPGIADLHACKAEYRLALSQTAYEADGEAIIDEAIQAYRLAIALSCAVEMAAADPARAPHADVLPSQI